MIVQSPRADSLLNVNSTEIRSQVCLAVCSCVDIAGTVLPGKSDDLKEDTWDAHQALSKTFSYFWVCTFIRSVILKPLKISVVIDKEREWTSGGLTQSFSSVCDL